MKILYGILPVVLLGLNAVHAQGVVTSTVSIDVGTCGPFSTVPVGGSSNGVPGSGSNNTVIGGGPSGIPGGSGDIPSSNTPGVLSIVNSAYGQYAFQGFFSAPSMGRLLNGASFTLSSMTLEVCSSFCAGTPYFAVEGTECSCGTVAPMGAPIYSPAQSTACAGNSNESCGTPGYAIVYSNLPRSSGPTSTVAQAPVISGQSATEANPVGSPTVIPYTSILPNGSTIIGFTSSPIPAASAPYTSILPDGSTVTGTRPAGVASSVAPYTSILLDGSTVAISEPASALSPIPPYTSVLPGSVTLVGSQPAGVSPTFLPQTSVLPGGSTIIESVPAPIPSSNSMSIANGGSSMITPSASPVITQPTIAGTAPAASATIALASDGLPAASETAVVTGPGGTEVPVVVYSGVDFPGADLPSPGGAKRLRRRAYTGNSIEDCMTECVNYVPSPEVAGGAGCVAASYDGEPNGQCYLKYSISAVNQGASSFEAGKIASYEPREKPVLVNYDPESSDVQSSALPGGGTPAPPPPAPETTTSAPTTISEASSVAIDLPMPSSSAVTSVMPNGDTTTVLQPAESTPIDTTSVTSVMPNGDTTTVLQPAESTPIDTTSVTSVMPNGDTTTVLQPAESTPIDITSSIVESPMSTTSAPTTISEASSVAIDLPMPSLSEVTSIMPNGDTTTVLQLAESTPIDTTLSLIEPPISTTAEDLTTPAMTTTDEAGATVVIPPPAPTTTDVSIPAAPPSAENSAPGIPTTAAAAVTTSAAPVQPTSIVPIEPTTSDFTIPVQSTPVVPDQDTTTIIPPAESTVATPPDSTIAPEPSTDAPAPTSSDVPVEVSVPVPASSDVGPVPVTSVDVIDSAAPTPTTDAVPVEPTSDAVPASSVDVIDPAAPTTTTDAVPVEPTSEEPTSEEPTSEEPTGDLVPESSTDEAPSIISDDQSSEPTAISSSTFVDKLPTGSVLPASSASITSLDAESSTISTTTSSASSSSSSGVI